MKWENSLRQNGAGCFAIMAGKGEGRIPRPKLVGIRECGNMGTESESGNESSYTHFE